MKIEKLIFKFNTPDTPSGLIYPKETMLLALLFYSKLIQEDKAYGRILPKGDSLPDEIHVPEDMISHKVVSLRFKNDEAFAVIEILDTEEGRKVKEFPKNSWTLSPRCTGDHDNVKITKCSIISIDIQPF